MGFKNIDIEGFDFESGKARFGGNEKLYAKIIKTFIDNIDPHLDILAGLTQENLADYAIEVHGIKGSLYGISANREGDMAKELEMAAKAGDYDTVIAGNAQLIASIKDLAKKLPELLDDFDRGSESGQRRAEPDKAILTSILEASRDFDVNKMQDALAELEKYEYDAGGELVKWLGEQITAFSYDKIEERLSDIL